MVLDGADIEERFLATLGMTEKADSKNKSRAEARPYKGEIVTTAKL
jgi:hypothetical protein